MYVRGQFTTVRRVYSGFGPQGQYTLELDSTTFAFGTVYEIEIETASPEDAKNVMYLFFFFFSLKQNEREAPKTEKRRKLRFPAHT